MAKPPHLISAPGKRPAKGLAAIVGAATAALMLVNIPREESGRKVVATIAADGTATLRHISGPQYLRAYLDIVGVATACDGITKGVRMGQTYSEAQCTALLERELAEHAKGVMACTPGLALTIPGRDRARFAAVSLAYNVGVAGYCRSTVARMFNAGQISAGCDALMMWNKVGGRAVAGLTARRGRERAVCLGDAA